MRNFVLTSESVTPGHPDKLCDQISDAVVDAVLTADPAARVTAECAVATGVLFLSVRTDLDGGIDPAAIARRMVTEAGSTPARPPTVMLDLARPGDAPGAPGTGTMTTAFGHACDHTEQHLAYPIWAAHRLTRAMEAARAEGRLPWLGADSQAQVAVAFAERRPAALRAIAVTTATPSPPPEAEAKAGLIEQVLGPAFEGAPVAPDAETRLVLRAVAGSGGPAAHAGLTGRKLSDDCYGGFARQGASALSGKDPGRVERLAACAARQLARALVKAGLAAEAEVQLSYLVGDRRPASVELDTFGSGRAPDEVLSARLAEVFDLDLGALDERLGLRHLPAARGGRFFRDLAAYGQMGRDDLSPPWEDMAEAAKL